MKDNMNLKRNDTSLRVLEILKMLIKEPMSDENLIKSIENIDNIENIYTKETLTKYFNTLEMVGLKINKNREDGKYYLKNFPVEIFLEENELKLLCLLDGYVKCLYQRSIELPFLSLKRNLISSFSKETLSDYKSIKAMSKIKSDVNMLCSESAIRRLEKYCVDGQKLKIGYLSKTNKSTEIHIVEPKHIFYELDKAYLMVYNPKLVRNQKLLIQNIIHIVQLPQKVNFVSNPNTVVFELKDRLARSYKLKEGEKVINHTENNLVISNSSEDKAVLFRRLLKYGESCKILQPTEVKREFISFVDEILNNLNRS